MRKTFLAFCICLSVLVNAQEFTPVVSCFDKNTYKADSQNWSITQDQNNVMHFGNGRCLLSFDGVVWEKTSLPYNKTVRSVYADAERIYVGSFEEFGYFERMPDGRLEYKSLVPLLGDFEMLNDEVWSILKVDGNIIFQTFNSYYIYDGESVSAFRFDLMVLFFCEYRGTIYTATDKKGLCSVDLHTGTLTSIPTPFESSLVTLLDNGDNAIAVSYSDGIYTFDGKEFQKIQTNIEKELSLWQVNKACISSKGDIIIGTLLNGVVAIDQQGKKKWEINSSNVLNNDTVLAMSYDADGNLWFALDAGIAVIPLFESLYYVKSIRPQIGSIYDAHYSLPYLYLGTSQGLYKGELSHDKQAISKVSIFQDIKGHVWDISEFDNQVFVGSNRGTYEVLSPYKLKEVCPVEGGMCMAKGRVSGREVLIQGTYTKLCIYTKEKGRWEYSHCIDEFMDPISSVIIDYQGTIWASHLQHGLYAIKLSDDLEAIAEQQYFDSFNDDGPLPIRVSSVSGRVVFSDAKQIWTYDDIKKTIVPYNELNEILGTFKESYKICESSYGSYWFITSSEAARLDYVNGRATISDIVPYQLFSSHTVDNYQNIVAISGSEDIFSLDNSLAIYTASMQNKQKATPKLKFNKICISDSYKDSLLVLDNSKARIAYKYRSLSFSVSCPQYSPVGDIIFKYTLNGRDRVWTELSSSPSISYPYLTPDSYTLNICALTSTGIELDSLDYEFSILHPFYWSIPARIIYILLIILITNAFVVIIKNRLRKNALETELKGKSKDLAATTLSLIRKNEVLNNIKQELKKENSSNSVDKVLRIIDRNISSDSDWDLFQSNFDRIHDGFFRKLQSRYPELTANDLRFCSFLRLNLSSKDIASLMNISLKGVEAARSRIRKKLSLQPEKSLTSFLIDI